MTRHRLRISSDTLFFVAALLSLILAYTAPWLFDPLMKGDKASTTLSRVVAHHTEAMSAASAQRAEPLTVLLLGLDARPGERTGRTDATVVARYDPEANRFFLLFEAAERRAGHPHGHVARRSGDDQRRQLLGGRRGGSEAVCEPVLQRKVRIRV